ncbi:hypothetical protein METBISCDRAFT_15121 [Metschnikowia bicuspidata]|uniref:TATA element modulatory factor 1 TATA binding domain-containing protein n=1 Tax=Metschnikowia bicuspidata TaxID=27322 RepID=A0A4P9ZDB4_9ASCO|nr:hypothetical protein METBISCDRAFT_15121 [Metschnikowia bicuspidata]
MPAPGAVLQSGRSKRLTLQERLALAAKTKNRLSSGPDRENAPAPEPTTAMDAHAAGAQQLDVQKGADFTRPDDTGAQEKAPKAAVVADAKKPDKTSERLEKETCVLRVKTEQLKKEVAVLSSAVDAKNREIAALKKSMPASLEKKLREKEQVIEQLMAEGQELSSKELKQNERIRALLALNKELESSLKNYADKNEHCLLQIGEIEDAMKLHNYASIGDLLDGMVRSSAKIMELQIALDRERKLNWEGKYKELQKLYDAALDEKRVVRKEMSEISVKLELLQQLSELEQKAKNQIIARLKMEAAGACDEARADVARLESKIEQLRLENEGFLKSTGADTRTAASTAHCKTVDYQDYARLSQSKQSLQKQFLTSQENWRTIELDLRQRLETLGGAVETLKQAKKKATADLAKVYGEFSKQTDAAAALRSEVSRITEEAAETAFKLKHKTSECAELEQQMQDLHTALETERESYEMKIQTLQDNVAALQRQDLSPAPVSAKYIALERCKYMSEYFPGLRSDVRSPLPLHSPHSFSSTHLAFPVLNTPYLACDEQDDTYSPLGFAADAVSGAILGANFSSEIYPQDAADCGSSATSVRDGRATKNIQLLSKMSATIRRLEVDIMSFKEENEQLMRDKEQAQQQILQHSALEQTVRDLTQRAEDLTCELQEKERNKEMLLQVLGEKSERVEELQADVADLKDLMRQQVQQMIEMQASCGR